MSDNIFDIESEVKAAVLKVLQDFVGGKADGVTGFGPVPGDDRVQIQGKEGQKIAWYRLDSDKQRHYISEESFTGKVLAVNTRDASGDRSNARKIDLTMRDSGGHTVTFVLGLKSSLDKPETTVGSKSLLAALASCPDNERSITIVPRLGDKNAAVVLMTVLVDGVSVSSGDPTEEESAANLTRTMATFGGTHTPLKGQEPAPAQVQQVRSAPAAAATVVPAKSGWAKLKFYLGDDDVAVAETREMILTWCKDRYGLVSPTKIPASDQAAALDECKKYLDEQSVPVAAVVSDDWSDDVPF